MVSSAILQPIVQSVDKLYNFVVVRKLKAIWMMMLLLLASGGLQMAYHICDKDGAHLNHGDCSAHSSINANTTDNCCSKDNSSLESNDCCTDAYLFALSPIPQIFNEIKLPPFNRSLISIFYSPNDSANESISLLFHRFLRQYHPPQTNLYGCHLELNCNWLI